MLKCINPPVLVNLNSLENGYMNLILSLLLWVSSWFEDSPLHYKIFTLFASRWS